MNSITGPQRGTIERESRPNATPNSPRGRDWRVPAEDATPDDPLLACLVLLTRMHNHPCSAESLTAGLPLVDHRLTPELFISAAARGGLAARVVKQSLGTVSPLVLPMILLLEGQRACILHERTGPDTAAIVDAGTGGVSQVSLAALAGEYSGYAILVRPQLKLEARAEQSGVAPQPRHWFWGVVRQAWPLYGEVLLASLMVNVFALVLPLFIMTVYDRVVQHSVVETLWALAIGTVIVLLFEFVMRMTRSYLIDLSGKRIDVVLSSSIFAKCLGLTMAARPPSVGSFASNLQEFDSFREFITSATIIALIDLPFVAIFMLMIFWLGGPVVLVPLVAMPLLVGVGVILQRSLRDVVRSLFQFAAQKQAVLVESLSGIEVVKTARAEGVLQRKWEQLIRAAAKLGVDSRALTSGIVNFSILVQQLTTVGVVVVGVYLIMDREMTTGALVACTILTGRAMAPLGQVAALMTRYHQSRSALESLHRIMQLPVERPAERHFVAHPPIRGDIDLRDVSFVYPNRDKPVLDGLTFSVRAGERVGLIGRIGSGKSTVAKLVLKLYEPTSGSIRIDGVDLGQIDPETVRKHIGYVPQDVVLFYGSVKDNIRFGAPYADDAALLRAAEIGGVTDFVHPSAQGFDLHVGERGEGLSGGQRQAISIARALLLDPPVLILDEPTNSFDSRSEEAFKARLTRILPHKTLLVVTHRASLLTLVDRLIVLDGGRVIADGPKGQVLEALSGGKIHVPG